MHLTRKALSTLLRPAMTYAPGLFRPKSKKRRRGFSFGERSYVKYEDVKKSKSSSQEDTARMDEILDKIKEKGYDSLTKEEKA